MTDVITSGPDASAADGSALDAVASDAIVLDAIVLDAIAPDASALPMLVAPPLFDEPALTKPRPSAMQVAAVQHSGPVRAAAERVAAERVAAEQRAERQSAVHRAAYKALAEMVSSPPDGPSLSTRVAAHAVMKQCLRMQSAAPERSRVDRLFGREPLHPDARSWYRGTLGELEVARILDRLDKRWTVLHAVPVGSAGADIDHVVIGPGGNFTINTKNHSGKKVWTAGTGFMVSGQKLAHIHNSKFEAKRAARLLSNVAGTPVAVTPLIVVVNPSSLVRKKPDVTVIESAELFRWMRRQPQMQTDATIARIVWAAERRETWTTLVDDAPAGAGPSEAGCDEAGRTQTGRNQTGRAQTAAQPDITGLERQFAELRATVETAESRRQVWSLLGIAAVLAVVVGSALLLAPLLPVLLASLMPTA